MKNPVLGKAKTRLAQSVGIEKAHDVYLALLHHTRSVALQFKGPRHLFYTDFIDTNDEWSEDCFVKHCQVSGQLGHRMQQAFEVLFDQRDETAGGVMIIGSDCPALRPEHIDQACGLLQESNVVLGPSEDGGYYLLGMDQFYPQLFTDIQWSTGSVLSETVVRAQQSDLSVAELEVLNDVDTKEDLLRSELAYLLANTP